MNYFWLTLKHKWFVFWIGLDIKVPIMRLILHDWSKLSLKEYKHYQRQFFGPKDDPEGFIGAWVHHQNTHDHHWEYFIPRTGHNRCTPPYPDNEPIPMPEDAIREMVADWMGASRAYDGKWPDINNWTWFNDNFPKLRLHEKTRAKILEIIQELNLAHRF